MMKNKIPMYIAVRLERGYGDTERAVWLPLPATKKEFEAAQEAIGADYGDFAITCYNVRVPGLYRDLLRQTPLAKVNHLASRLAVMDEDALVKLCAIIDSDRNFTEIDQFVDYTYNHSRFALLPEVTNARDLGLLYLNGKEFSTVPAAIRNCVDPFKLGLNIAAAQDGQFTAQGYLTTTGSWYSVPKQRAVPAALNLTGFIGEDLYGEWEDDSYFEYELEDGDDE